jgi:hypothetical protein
MASGTLVRDQESNITAAGVRKNDGMMEYEFAFPYQNDDLGDTLWEVGKAYQLAVLVGSSEEFSGVTPETWMSDQIHIRLGTPSTESIYDPPYLAAQAQEDQDHHQRKEAEKGEKTHEQKGQQK